MLLHRRDLTDASSCLSALFFLLSSFCSAAVFKVRHLNKSVLMAAMQRRLRREWGGEEGEEGRHNLITVTVLFNELKASGSDSRPVYYFVLARYM